MSELRNDLLLKALRGEEVARPPVWMMRQAGRYLPDYIKLREKYSFFERCRNAELATEITVMPVDQVGVDAAIIFSDILVVPQAMGLEVQLIEGKGPILPDPIRQEKDMKRVAVPDVADSLNYVMEAIALTKKTLAGKVPLIGFAGAPWTLLCYMVEGRGSKTFDKAKAFCYTQPELAKQLLQMLTETTIAYLRAQVQAGADCVQLFDSWGGLLGPEDFRRWSLPYLEQIVKGLDDICPVILFAKGAWHSLKEMSASGAKALGVDWCIEPKMARQLAGDVTLQGNFDPAKLLSPVAEIEKSVKAMIDDFGVQKYIANLGHGILPNVPVDHAKAFVNAVKHYAQNPVTA